MRVRIEFRGRAIEVEGESSLQVQALLWEVLRRVAPEYVDLRSLEVVVTADWAHSGGKGAGESRPAPVGGGAPHQG